MVNLNPLLYIYAGFLILAGCNEPLQDQDMTPQFFEKAQQVEIETLDKGYHANTADQNLVIKTQQDFKTFWSSLHSGRSPVPDLPEIDFDSTMVIATIMESQSSGGYAVEITEAGINDGQLGIKVQNKIPGEGCATTAAITTPYHIVAMGKTDRPISFVEEEVQVDCNR